ncbi:hypothetical protein OSTOST_19323, partial [Ostertagia ostertagi]
VQGRLSINSFSFSAGRPRSGAVSPYRQPRRFVDRGRWCPYPTHNPQHSYVQLQNVEPILARLLDLIDECTTGETLLLVSAALANVSLQDPTAIDILYRRNAIIRLINAYNRQECSTIFVQEQIVTVLSRLAARRYEEALVSQGAVPVLLEMLTVTDSLHSDYCRRIRYKAAVCIGTLAATGVGLKALYVNQGNRYMYQFYFFPIHLNFLDYSVHLFV